MMPRFRTLQPSPLQPDFFWVDRFSFEMRPDRRERAGNAVGVKADIQFRGSADDPDGVLVRLVLESSASKYDESLYDFSLEMGAVFKVENDDDPVSRRRLIRYNAPAVLYGLARGYVASATAMALAPPLILPSVDLVEFLRPRRPSGEGADEDPAR